MDSIILWMVGANSWINSLSPDPQRDKLTFQNEFISLSTPFTVMSPHPLFLLYISVPFPPSWKWILALTLFLGERMKFSFKEISSIDSDKQTHNFSLVSRRYSSGDKIRRSWKDCWIKCLATARFANLPEFLC